MRASILLPLLAAGCTTETNPPRTDLSEIEPGTVSAIQIVPTVGSGVLDVPVRLNNAFGLPIPGGTPPVVTVSGTGTSLLSDDFTPDTFGVVTVSIDAPQPAAVTVTADGTAGTAWSADGAPDILAIRGGSYPVDAPLPAFAAAGTGGSAFAGDDQIWWQPAAPGAPAWRTADLPSTIEGMWTAQIDGDGVSDLAVWAGEQVYLLRGWPGGGYAWGAAWDVAGGDVVGVSATDVDGDRLTDLVIGIDYGQDGRVELLRGDGAWGFEILEPLELTFGISTITAADENLDGQPDISVLRSIDGSVRRYSFLEGGWSGGTPAQISIGSNESTLIGGTLRPMADLNGDGDLELVVEGPKGASSQRLVFFSFNGQTIIKYEQAYANYYLDVADMEGDGAMDVLAIEDGTLHVTRYDTSGGSFIAQNYSSVGEAGPLAIGDIDGDELLDLAVFGDGPTYYPGAASEGASSAPGNGDCTDGIDNDKDGTIDGDDPQCDGWRLSTYTWRTFGLNLADEYAIVDLNQDGLDDIIGYVGSGTDWELKPWITSLDEDGQPQLTPGGSYALYNSGIPLDLAVCGEDIYSLYETQAGVGLLVRVSYGDGALSQARANNEVSGTLLACGQLSGEDAAVVATTSGEWVSYEQSRLDTLSSGFIEAVGAVAVADGAVVGCQGDGCSVVAGDVDGDGTEEIFRSEAAGLTVEGWGTTQEISGEGELRLVDGDQDGRPEVLVTDIGSQRISWYPGVSGGLAPATTWWRDGSVAGAARLADLNQDGVPELVLPTEDGGLTHSPTLP